MTKRARRTAVERAREDVAAGELWRARARLEGALGNSMHAETILDALGDVCFRMGDLPAAGLYWFLTGRDDLRVEEATVAMRSRYRGATALLSALPIRGPIEAYPGSVQTRLRDLVDASPESWSNLRKRDTLGVPRTRAVEIDVGGDSPGFLLFLVALVAVWLLGAVTLAYLAYRLVAALL